MTPPGRLPWQAVLPCNSINGVRFEARDRRSGQGASRLALQPSIPWRQITRMRDHLAHRYFDTAHAILQATVDDDLPTLERAIRTLADALTREQCDDPGS